ncbi:MAG: hypothetical protein LIP09_16255 [Bacteroidales bacterium]|nr:hypothetical protein [Bacteroidales bacterium]
MTIEERRQLYHEIKQRDLSSSENWRVWDINENMVLISKVIYGYWKPIYLVDELNKTAMQFMDFKETLLNVSDDDIDWHSLEGIKLVGIDRIKERDAHFPTNIRGFKNGVAEVDWEIHPDGMYFMDDDGYGRTNDRAETLYGYIDRNGNMIVPFTYVGKDWDKLTELHRKAEKMAMA